MHVCTRTQKKYMKGKSVIYKKQKRQSINFFPVFSNDFPLLTTKVVYFRCLY